MVNLKAWDTQTPSILSSNKPPAHEQNGTLLGICRSWQGGREEGGRQGFCATAAAAAQACEAIHTLCRLWQGSRHLPPLWK